MRTERVVCWKTDVTEDEFLFYMMVRQTILFVKNVFFPKSLIQKCQRMY